MWPLAVANLVKEGESATIWSRLHARQALVFGVLCSFVFFVLLAFPLVVVLAVPSISPSATIAVYSIGLAADVAFGLIFILVAIRLAARAAQGELFSLPLVTPIVDRWLRVDRR